MHGPGQLFLERRDIADDALEARLVEHECLCHVIEHAQIVDDQPVRLGAAIRAVGAADRQQQGVIWSKVTTIPLKPLGSTVPR